MSIYVAMPSMPPIEEYVDEIRDIWETRVLTNFGLKHRTLEKELSRHLECENLSLFSSGHLALEAALAVLDLKGEVITTPFTFASTTQAIVRAGLKPVFGDIRSDDYTLDPDKIEELINEKTCAVMPVHVYGNLCDFERIDKIACKYGLKVIYDAAHAFGMKKKDVSIGNYGDISMFSFHATKVFHSIEGGALTYKDATLASKLEEWCMFGLKNQEDAVSTGTNAKLTEFASAMGLCNLRHVDDYISLRSAVVSRYRERLEGHSGIILNEELPDVKYNYAYMPVRFIKDQCGKSRDEICAALNSIQVFPRKYFYPLTNDFSVIKNSFEIKDTPIAKEVSEQVICLPLYSDLKLSEVDMICDKIIEEVSL